MASAHISLKRCVFSLSSFSSSFYCYLTMKIMPLDFVVFVGLSFAFPNDS